MRKLMSFFLFFVTTIVYISFLFVWIVIPNETIVTVTVSVVTLVMTIVTLVVERKYFYHLYKSEKFKVFSQRLFGAFLLFLILCLLNYMAYKNPKSADLSEGGFSSLSDASRNAIRDAGEIHLTLYASKVQHERAKFLLELYRKEDKRMKVTFVDAGSRPDLVEANRITQIPFIVVEGRHRKENVLSLSEESITHALIKVSRAEDPIICIDESHLGGSFDNTGAGGFSYFLELIKKSAYQINFVHLASNEFAANCKTFVLWGPKNKLSEDELSKIEEFLKNGGRFLLALDPQFNGDDFENIRQLLQTYGIVIENNLVIDEKNFVSGSKGTVPLIKSYQNHSIVAGMSGQTFFPLASSVSIMSAKPEDNVLFYSSTKSWGEQSFSEFVKGPLEYHEFVDKNGPVGLAVALRTERNGAIVAFGNSTFVSNDYQRFPNNFLLALNSISWLAFQDGLISLDRPLLKETPIFIGEVQTSVIFYFSVLALPLLFSGLAMFFYRRRISL